MVYFFTNQDTESAHKLQELLGAKSLVKHDGFHFIRKGRPMEFAKEDSVVCWGRHVPQNEQGNIINANLRYVDQLQLNLWLGYHAKRIGLYTTGFRKMSTQGYEKAMRSLASKAVGTNWPYKEFPNYCGATLKFAGDYKVHVLGGKVVRMLERVSDGKKWYVFKECPITAYPTIADFAPMVTHAMDVNFAAVYLSNAGSNVTAVRKILTAPPLDAQGLTLYSEYILNLIKHRNESPEAKPSLSIGEKIAATTTEA